MSSPSLLAVRKRILLTGAAALGLATFFAAHADLAPWMQTVVSASVIENALYRAMDLPGVKTLYPRPPAEALSQLNALIANKQQDAQLYALRAHVDEESLDFTAAATDWKAFIAHADAGTKTTAEFALADFYHRRNAGPDEIAALETAAAAPSSTAETFLPADQQQAWQAFPRALTVAHDQALGDDARVAIYTLWIARYPAEPSVRAALISTLLSLKRYDDAQRAIDAYKAAFPQDQLIPIKAAALLAFDQGNADATARALALFDKAYQPLWDQSLIASYFELLSATHTQHAFLAANRAELLKNPDDLVAATKIFAYYQQQGHQDAAINSLAQYGASKDLRHAAWTPDELYTFATLLDRTAQYQDAARYYYALAAATGRLAATTQSPEEAGLAGLIHVLLTAPDQPIALGAGNLSIYRDIATLDRGPGYLNGILSLWLNSQTPASEFHDEEDKATPYFHRAKAAELLAVLDARFPASAARPGLHAQLIQAYIAYGQDAAVKQAAQQFLTDFPKAAERNDVALELADVYARTKDTTSEFALYDSLLAELGAGLQGMPLSASGVPAATAPAADTAADATPDTPPPAPTAADLLQQSLTLGVTAPPAQAAAQQYSQILERYLGRLTTTKQLPAALVVLRHELDRSPNDPRLYERLADFLEQNNLAAQEEEVYQTALTHFSDTTFYDKLARFYIRQKRNADFDTLTHKVVDIFAGTELDAYFANVDSKWSQEYLQLNLYAAKRFPHDLVFTRNLLTAYQAKGTLNAAAWAQLLRQHWQESPDLQDEFFDYLSRTNKLSAELTALQALVPAAAQQEQNAAATHELAEIDIWQSHFEQGAPLLGALAAQYPADTSIGEQAVSLFRSLAYFDPAQIAHAVDIEKHLSAAEPTNLDRLAMIGDIYANSTANSLNLDAAQQLATASPFWKRMAAVHPGVADGYIQSAAVFWDYFQFDDALAQIAAARTHFADATLYGFEAGAIYENKHDYPHAIAEYVAAAIAHPASDADASLPAADADPTASGTPTDRLQALAALPKYAALVDQATAKAVADDPSVAALNLRVSILTALHQEASIASVVDAAVAHASTADAAAGLADFAQMNQLPKEYEAALQREIVLTTDPMQHIELEYQLARAYEDQKDVASAQHIIEAVYAPNSKLIGVVRTTTDFYWNNKQQARAVATLVQASHDANPGLAHDFLLEAIAKSNQSADYNGARTLLKPLLASDPYNAQYLSLQADSFALAHNDAGVRDLYSATIASLTASTLSAADKRDKIALARQALIPALTNLKDYAGATDQHIALISAFPEDDTILQNAISYARLYTREPQLVDFLNKTVAASPKDSRFAIDLAKVDLQFEDYTGALAAYTKAIAIRSDRADLYIARADLEEHQQAFDAACADYDRLYLLTYKDPQWMEKEALARARQSKDDLVVKALQAAWIDGRPALAANDFQVAKELEGWNMLSQADTFAAQGVKLAGDDLLATPQNSDGALLYVRLLTRERKAPQAFTLLTQLRDAAKVSPSSPAIVVQQIKKQGIAAVTDSDWRAHLVQVRQQQASTTFNNAVQQMAMTVATFYTPEEKATFATLLDTQRANRPAQEVADVWINAAANANLRDREAAWRRDVLLNGLKLAPAQLAPFNDLETARMDFTLQATTLDAYALKLKPASQAPVISMAAAAWRNAGNAAQETTDLRKLVLLQNQKQYEDRLFEIYMKSNTAALLLLTSSKTGTVADDAANYILAHDNQALTAKAITNRAATRAAVWNTATHALVGLYFGDTSPEVDAAFETSLADGTIGQRLGTKFDATKQLTGDAAAYYGARYGFFLTLPAKPAHDAEDYLPAQLEAAPSDTAAYTALAQTYMETHNPDAAMIEYRHAIELDATDPAPDVSIAEIFWQQGRKDDAVAEWNAALTKLRAMIDQHAVPETFWTSFAAIAKDVRDDQLGAQMQPGMNAVLVYYIHKNDSYRTAELLQSAYTARSKDNPAAATAWVLALVNDATTASQPGMLSDLTSAHWFPKAQLDSIYLREIALAQAEAQASQPNTDGTPSYAHTQVIAMQTTYIQWLMQQKRIDDAERVLDTIPAAERDETLETITVMLAAKQARIPALLASYTAAPASAPTLDVLQNAAETLRAAKDYANCRLLLEYVFQQQLQQQALTSSSYLALAEARINTGDLPGALDLLNRLVLQGDLYENLDTAAMLLVRTGHNAEALPMLTKLANGAPWDSGLRLRLGQAQLALQQSTDASASLSAVATSDQAAYADRAAAARSLKTLPGTKQFSSIELTLLAAETITPAQASQPYFLYARIDAATAAAVTQRPALLRAAIAMAPDTAINALRVSLFQAEFTEGQYEQASIAIAGVLASDRTLLPAGPQDSADDTDADTAGTSNTPDAADTPSAEPLFASADAERAFTLSLATMDEHLGDTPQTIVDLKSALHFTTDATQKPPIKLRIKALQAGLDLAAQNLARRPVIQADVVQTVLVRPRLSAPTGTTPAEARP